MTRAPSRVVVTPTKIRLPVPATAVARPRLDDHADRITAFSATIVSAGAGFGKTTILHAWAKRCAAKIDVAWLGLDEGDGRPRALASYLEAAIRRVLPGLGPSITTLLDEGTNEPVPLARALVYELYEATEESRREIVVFLDDFHTVQTDPGVREFVGEMLRLLPPRAHIVLATRFPCDFSPLVKLRAERRIADFDHNDLRFRDDEIVALLADAGLATPDHVALRALSRRTDGWAMALRLSTQAPGEIRGDDLPLGEQTERSLFAYMAEEVLRSQPPDVRELLLVASIPKHLDAETVAQITGGDGARELETLLRRNLYLEPTGERVYRFHNLFREFLLHTFEREALERTREIRRAYARLLEARGDIVAAVSQYIQAGDYRAAMDHVGPAIRSVKWGDDFERIARVLAEIPEEVMRERPDVLRLQTLAKRRSLDIPGTINGLERSVIYAHAVGDAFTEALGLIDLAMLYRDMRLGGFGEYDRNIEMCERALEIIPPGPRGRSIEMTAHLAIGAGYAAMFRYAEANPHIDRVVDMELAGRPRSTDMLNAASYFYGTQGNWPKALELAELSASINSEAVGIHTGRALRLEAQARVYLRDDLGRALAAVEEGVEYERSHNQFENLCESYITLAQTLLFQEVPLVSRAHAALDEAERRLRRWQNHVVQFDLHLTRVVAHVIDGDRGACRKQLVLARTLAERHAEPKQRTMLQLVEAYLRALARDSTEAIALFETARDGFDRVQDAYYAALAHMAAAGLRARENRLDPTDLAALLTRLERNLGHVVLAAPRSASHVLHWALGERCQIERAVALLEPSAHLTDAGRFATLAGDPRFAIEARVAAVGILARDATPRRELLERLARDPSPAVSAAATTALGLMPSTSAPRLSLWVVGRAVVALGDERIDERDSRWGRRKAVELLRALALADGPIPKAVVMRELWPQSSTSGAETSLRVTLHALRRALQPDIDGPGDYVEFDGTSLALRPQAIAFVDAREAVGSFRRAALARSRGATADARGLFERTVSLLPAIPTESDAPAWLGPHVRIWRDALCASLTALARIDREAGDLVAARTWVERALLLDPLDEPAVGEAIETAVASGDFDRARRIFVAYKERLHAELDARPSPDLMERYRLLLGKRPSERAVDLSERDLDVLRLVGQGRSSKQIAADLGVKVFAVNAQIARIMRKLRVESRAAAVAAAGGLLER